MNKFAVLYCCLGLVSATSVCQAVDLKEAKITQVVNDVQIISADRESRKAAEVNDIFSVPDFLRTGTASRAELVAEDKTITRIGANTIFSFDAATRTIDLKQGSLLFHAPHGKGGGTIQTGSATASVLGTTLIVSTTPDGGFKVLDLEGKVKVKFQNGLDQTLLPGYMTFILPGSHELAPMVIFRLDTLLKNSLLVKGFQNPLPSLPLIFTQMQKQLKLIESGRMKDTGFYAGDYATPNQVQVVDPNTIQVNNSGTTDPLQTDATINQPSLAAATPAPPSHILLTPTFALTGNSYFSGQSFTGFGAMNIFFTAPASGAGPLTVDLSSYATLPVFDIVAVNNLNFQGATTFAGFDSSGNLTLSLIAGNQFQLTPGVTVAASVNDFEWNSAGSLDLNGATVNNNTGTLGLTSGTGISMENNASLTGSSVNVNAGQGVTIANSTLTGSAANGGVTINAGGTVSISGSTLNAEFLTVGSGDGILLTGNGAVPEVRPSNSGAHPALFSFPTVNLQAVNTISVSQMDLSSYTIINMAANTINLSDVNLGSGLVTLRSLLGELNVGSSKSGYVNFIQNVIYDGGAAQNYVNNGGGITVTTLH